DHRDLHSFLHDALPISSVSRARLSSLSTTGLVKRSFCTDLRGIALRPSLVNRFRTSSSRGGASLPPGTLCFSRLTMRPLCSPGRSEEHTSELQSRENLV